MLRPMKRRLPLAVSACCVLVLAARGTSAARAVTEVEGAAYEGESSGNWGCGPGGRVRYGGLAAQVRHSQRRPDAESGLGATVIGGAALELQRVPSPGGQPTFDSPDDPGSVSEHRVDTGLF